MKELLSLILVFIVATHKAPIPAGIYDSSPASVEVMKVIDLDVPHRPYWPVKIAAIPTTKHTHIQVVGKVALVKHEQDGDLHIRLSDGRNFIVAECIPELPCAAPRVGQRITVEGISRQDKEHGWYEVHPVEKLVVSQGEK